MNKAELIAAVAENAELTKKDAEKAVKAFIDVVTDEQLCFVHVFISSSDLSCFIACINSYTCFPIVCQAGFLDFQPVSGAFSLPFPDV